MQSMTVEVEHATGGSSASGRINVADYRADIHGAVIKTERFDEISHGDRVQRSAQPPFSARGLTSLMTDDS